MCIIHTGTYKRTPFNDHKFHVKGILLTILIIIALLNIKLKLFV